MKNDKGRNVVLLIAIAAVLVGYGIWKTKNFLLPTNQNKIQQVVNPAPEKVYLTSGTITDVSASSITISSLGVRNLGKEIIIGVNSKTKIFGKENIDLELQNNQTINVWSKEDITGRNNISAIKIQIVK